MVREDRRRKIHGRICRLHIRVPRGVGKLLSAELREVPGDVEPKELTVEFQKAPRVGEVGKVREIIFLHGTHKARGNPRLERYILHAQFEREPGMLQLLTNGRHAARELPDPHSETGNPDESAWSRFNVRSTNGAI